MRHFDSPGWSDWGYQEIQTADGSPTLRSSLSPESESMHHHGGALSESRMIYGPLIARAFQQIPTGPRFLSLGLGLGYNEILIAQESLIQSRSWSCVSYESDSRLTESFCAFVDGTPSPRNDIYEKIFSRMEDPEGVRRSLSQARHEGRWQIRAGLGPGTDVPFFIHAFLWDAFSQKTSPDLWQESFLHSILSQTADPQWCGFSSYGCLGSLKRGLGSAGFQVEVRAGFSTKKNSTWALRVRTEALVESQPSTGNSPLCEPDRL